MAIPWLAMAVGSGVNMLMADQAFKQQKADEQRSLNAAADATAVSWARRDGRGQIPQARYAKGTHAGALLRGGLAGAQMGMNVANMSAPKAPVTDKLMDTISPQLGQAVQQKAQKSPLGVDYSSLANPSLMQPAKTLQPMNYASLLGR